MKTSYYNTNKESGIDLKESNAKAKTQEQFLMDVFYEKESLTASQAWSIYCKEVNSNTPLTSIRRAMTNLCDEGLLYKTDDMREGLYGKKEHIYRVVSKVPIEQLHLFSY